MKIAMKTLADLKRTIKVGTRLYCIENTLRPELNGRTRLVVKAQGNSFAWVYDPEPVHDQTLDGCMCGMWKDEPNDWSTLLERYEAHVKCATSRSWTTYEKASAFTFDGDRFTMQLKPGTHVTLAVLPEEVTNA